MSASPGALRAASPSLADAKLEKRRTSPPSLPTIRMWSIRWIVTGAMVLLATGSVIAVGAVAERNARRVLEAEIKAQLLLQARNLAMVGSGALLSSVPEWTLLPLIKELREREAHLAFVVVADRAGVIQAEADVRRLGTRFAPPAGLGLEPGARASIAGEMLQGNRDLLVASAPIVHADGRRLGTSWVALRRVAIQSRLDQARRQQMVVLCLLLLVGTGTALLLSSLLLRPIGALRTGLERIARGDLETRIELQDRTELGALAGVVNRMASELKSAQVELIERERIAHEVQLARRLQRSLLPAAGRVAGPFRIEGMQRAAAEVGGDYFQTLDLPRGRIGLVVADVCGKGLAGSLVTAMLHASLRPLAALHDSPAQLLAALDRQIATMLERGNFVTMFYGILDPERGEVTFASAGHNPVLVVRSGGRAEWIQSRGSPLAAVRVPGREARYEEVTIRLAPGEVLVQYTDGVHEAFGPDGESGFGLERVAEAAARAAGAGCMAVLAALSEAVCAWRAGAPQHDDETLLVVSRELDRAPDGSGFTPEMDGLAALAQAQARGQRLTLPASLRALVRIEDWLATLPELSQLEGRAATLLRLALHEACANVVEHAYGKDGSRTFDLWWLPASESGALEGLFLLRDRGAAFRYQSDERPRLEDPALRRRGRGLGLEILRRVMRSVAYHPGTPEGNLTSLSFAAAGLADMEETDGCEG
jgi:serine phosphatase RsbU (regulator of sigma subunit)/anti-sigma regulatory factor (Ser/Thr protein kinase)